jgi:hypothetical protein
VTGPGSASDTSYVPTPAASYAANYASPEASTASTPASTPAASYTGDYISGEQYRYALTNFVRTSIQNISFTFPLTFLPIPPYGFVFVFVFVFA